MTGPNCGPGATASLARLTCHGAASTDVLHAACAVIYMIAAIAIAQGEPDREQRQTDQRAHQRCHENILQCQWNDHQAPVAETQTGPS